MDKVKTLADCVIQDSDIVKAITKSPSDTNVRIDRHYDELKQLANETKIQYTRIEERIRYMDTILLGGFMIMGMAVFCVIIKLYRLQK